MFNIVRAAGGRSRLGRNLRVSREAERYLLNQVPALGTVRRGFHQQTTVRTARPARVQRASAAALLPYLCGAAGLACAGQLALCDAGQAPNQAMEDEPDAQEVINWSGTHTVETKRYYQPESLEELKTLVRVAHEKHEKLRPIGSALSPNGLAFEKGGMVNLAMMDEVLEVDLEKQRVRVQAGAKVNQVVEALRPHGLTLQNFASITEQQIGGFTQVGAHGTGARIPPVDEQVVAIKLITPAAGELDLSAVDEDPSLFQLARTSLGMIGIVAEVTLQCVPAHQLVEKTVVMTRAQIENEHDALMENNKHLRYMWIPHTDAVVVVTCNPLEEGTGVSTAPSGEDNTHSEAERLAAPRELLKRHPACKLSEAQIAELGFTTLRDELLSLDPLNVKWVKQVNAAEAEFWKRSAGTRVDWSDKVLQFNCGGQQWVSEVAFPVPKQACDHVDVRYVQRLLDMVEAEGIPAPAPIEQRWTAPSLSPLSPAGEKPDIDLAGMYSWVGIIMYLPDSSGGAEARARITRAFNEYRALCEAKLWPEARAVEHWAKIEMPDSAEAKARLQRRMERKYPVAAFKAICNIFDPHGILRNDLMNVILDSKPIPDNRVEVEV